MRAVDKLDEVCAAPQGLDIPLMQTLLSLFILATSAVAAPDGRYPDAVEVFHCDFGSQWDQTYDRWPDRWTRLRSPAFPAYLPARIVDDATAQTGHCLRIDLDGGGAAVFSPPIKISPMFSYVLEVQLKAEAAGPR